MFYLVKKMTGPSYTFTSKYYPYNKGIQDVEIIIIPVTVGWPPSFIKMIISNAPFDVELALNSDYLW